MVFRQPTSSGHPRPTSAHVHTKRDIPGITLLKVKFLLGQNSRRFSLPRQ